MDERKPERQAGLVWPGLGLVLGAGIGSVVGLILAPSVFFLWSAAGAGLGLVVGAAVQSYRPG